MKVSVTYEFDMDSNIINEFLRKHTRGDGTQKINKVAAMSIVDQLLKAGNIPPLDVNLAIHAVSGKVVIERFDLDQILIFKNKGALYC